jgi:hypothetical protein
MRMEKNIPPPLPYSITDLWDHKFSEAVTRKYNALKEHLGTQNAEAPISEEE